MNPLYLPASPRLPPPPPLQALLLEQYSRMEATLKQMEGMLTQQQQQQQATQGEGQGPAPPLAKAKDAAGASAVAASGGERAYSTSGAVLQQGGKEGGAGSPPPTPSHGQPQVDKDGSYIFKF